VEDGKEENEEKDNEEEGEEDGTEEEKEEGQGKRLPTLAAMSSLSVSSLFHALGCCRTQFMFVRLVDCREELLLAEPFVALSTSSNLKSALLVPELELGWRREKDEPLSAPLSGWDPNTIS
jgi:hypothetical protein